MAICLRIALLVAWALLLMAPSCSETVGISTDVSVDLAGSVLDDESVALDEGAAGFTPEALGSIPNHADIDGFHPLSNGDKLISFDTTVELPGGLRAEPADVILWDGSSYSVDFDGRAAGIPDGARVDAVTEIGGAVAVSFDTSVDFAGVVVDDEDLVYVSGAGIVFDGSAQGVSADLDLDGAGTLESGSLALSFDGSGDVGAGFSFDDEDVLEYDPGSGGWSLLYDGSAAHGGFDGADTDAVFVPEPGELLSMAFGIGFLWLAGKRRNSRRMTQ